MFQEHDSIDMTRIKCEDLEYPANRNRLLKNNKINVIRLINIFYEFLKVI